MTTLKIKLNQYQKINQDYIKYLIKDMQNYDGMIVENFLNSEQMNEFDRLLMNGIEMRKKMKQAGNENEIVSPLLSSVADNYIRTIDEKKLKHIIKKQN